jgi:hypothetical protein
MKLAPILIVAAACSGARAADDVDAALPTAPDAADDRGRAIINEVAASGSPADWFELYNPGGVDLVLDGYHFSDDQARPEKGAFPTGTTLAPRGFAVQEVSDQAVGFKLGSDEALYLYDPDGVEVDAIDWVEGESPPDGSLARLPDGSGTPSTVRTPTPGAPNHG